MRWARLPLLLMLLVLLMMGGVARAASDLPPGEPAGGISRELAQWRSARYTHLRYTLELDLTDPERVSGQVVLRFRFLGDVSPLVLDWRPAAGARLPVASVTAFRVNDVAVQPDERDGHLIVPAGALRSGENHVAFEFVSPVGVAGTAVTRYRDREDGAEYLYSLLVPADASTLFPCIDQPDLKARFTLSATAGEGATVVANAPLAGTVEQPGRRRFRFAETEPTSTYLFAFAAGPFAEFRDEISGTRMFVRKSQEARARSEVGEVLRLNREALAYFARYFAQPFPFAKYDLVLLPEFAYGGMEHAGATFLREDAVLFPSEPAATDRLRRAQLVFHEASHQWFGDLVTMRWFDDLWLKEGFANLMAAKAARELLPEIDARNAFRALKVSAYRTDVTEGTTPIWQPLPNLAAAKSAYGSIVYSKAPAVLHQAEFYLGAEAFQTAVRAFLAEHAYASASWDELVRAFETASGTDLQQWARAWVTDAGMPQVDVEWDAGDDGLVRRFLLVQRPLPRRAIERRHDGPWPQRVELLLAYDAGRREVIDVRMDQLHTAVDVPAISGAPRFVFANRGDWGYGLFLLDARSQSAVIDALGNIDDAFLRALLWDALWESVREGRLRPAQWVALAIRALPAERDEVTVAGLVGYLQTAVRWYLPDPERSATQAAVEAMLRDGMLGSETLSLRITYFRAYVALAQSEPALALLRQLLDGDVVVPGLTLRSADRFRILRTLLAEQAPDAERRLAAQAADDTTGEGKRYAYAAEAARPDPMVKRRYFQAFLDDPALPERWIEDSLAPFNPPEQADLTLPYLESALEALPALKRERRIFFVNNWLAAFINGQRSSEAQHIVEQWLAHAELEPDLRRKVLEALDALRRTVAIRGPQE